MDNRFVYRLHLINLLQPVFPEPDQHPRLALHRAIVLCPPQRDITFGDPLFVCVTELLFLHPDDQGRASDL